MSLTSSRKSQERSSLATKRPHRPRMIADAIRKDRRDWSRYDVAYSIFILSSAIFSGSSIVLYYAVVGHIVFATLFGLAGMTLLGAVGGWLVRVWCVLDTIQKSCE